MSDPTLILRQDPVAVQPFLTRLGVTVEEAQLTLAVSGGKVSVAAAETRLSLAVTTAPVELQAQATALELRHAALQGPPGPPGPPGSAGATVYTAENRDTVPFPIGAALAIHPSGVGVVLADASANGRQTVGLAAIGVDPGFAETVQVGGPFNLGDWSAVTGTVTLQARALYFLDSIPGQLTPQAPSTPGLLCQLVGVAVAPGTLDLSIVENGILL